MVRHGEQEPDFEPDGDNVHWIIRGETPSELIGEMIVCADSQIAVDVVEQLSNDHSFAIGRDGDTDWYDESSDTFVLETPDDPEFRDAWASLCQSVKHERRFFSENATPLLDKILGPILDGQRRVYRGVIRTITPGAEDSFIYRGRLANEEATRTRIYSAPIAELGAPPPAFATAGRMNSAGISVFYASTDAATAAAELRVPVGGFAVVGRFEIIRPLRILDLTRTESLRNDLSYFHRDYFVTHSHASFLRGFHREIRKPIVPSLETLEYLPTQVVAEYLWTRGERAVDGLVFGSAQGGALNIVLFPHACMVENVDEEVRREIAGVYQFGGDDENEPDNVETVYLHPTPAPPDEKKVSFADLDDFWFEPPDEEARAAVEPSLRLDTKTICKVEVTGIRYSTQTSAVELRDKQDIPF